MQPESGSFSDDWFAQGFESSSPQLQAGSFLQAVTGPQGEPNGTHPQQAAPPPQACLPAELTDISVVSVDHFVFQFASKVHASSFSTCCWSKTTEGCV